MKIRWWGQSCFEIAANSGLCVVTDPFGAHARELFPEVAADWVTIGRGGEQGLFHVVRGEPQIADKPEVYPLLGGGRIIGITPSQGPGMTLRGPSNLFEIELDGLRIAHLGDLSQELDHVAFAALARVDVLIVPIHGSPTPLSRVGDIARSLAPSIVLPMSATRYTYPPEAFDALADALGVPPLAPEEALFDPRTLMRANVTCRPVRLPMPSALTLPFAIQ